MTEPGIEAAALLPCPFCGKPPILDEHPPTPGEDDSFCVIRCAECGFSKERNFTDDAVRWWNRRPAASGDLRSLAWIYEDELPKGYPYDAMFKYSEVRSGVRMFPVYAPGCAASLPGRDDEAIRANELERCAKTVPEREAFWLLESVGGGRWAVYTSANSFVHAQTSYVWQAARFDSERHAHDVWRMLNKEERERWKPTERVFVNKIQPLKTERGS